MLWRLFFPYPQAAVNHLGKRGRIRQRTTLFVNCVKRLLSGWLMKKAQALCFLLRASKLTIKMQDTKTTLTQTVTLTRNLCYNARVRWYNEHNATSVDLPRVISQLFQTREKREWSKSAGERLASCLADSEACSTFDALRVLCKESILWRRSSMPYELEQENINISKKFPTHRCNEKMFLLIHRQRLVSDIFPTPTDIRYTNSHRYNASHGCIHHIRHRRKSKLHAEYKD